jgi:hypothetical protein
MARTIRTKVYKFNELSQEAKETAIEHFADINLSDWFDMTLDEEVRKLKELGFDNPKIYFSGFASQGDGACFTCYNVDFRVFMNGKYKDYSTALSCSITHNYRYFFATSTTVHLDIDDNVSEEIYNEIEEAVKDERERLGNEIYRTLEKEYDYLTSEASIIETIEANEYEFTKDGMPFYK